MSRRQQLAIFLTAALMIGTAGFLVFLRSEKAGSDYIFDRSSQISWRDLELCSRPVPTGRPQQATSTNKEVKLQASDFFSEGKRLGPGTLQYFKYLDIPLGKKGRVEEHLARVRHTFSQELPADDAKKAFQLYEKYLRCEMDLSKEYKNWGSPKDPAEIISMLRRMQEYRRGKMGDDNADALFGGDVKMREYKLRRATIVAEKTSYGEEKERRLHGLAKDMWGEEAEMAETLGRPRDRYREKLDIYSKDLAEMDDGPEKKALIGKFRRELLSPEEVERIERADARQAISQQSAARNINPADQPPVRLNERVAYKP
ncbi:MAG: lipase secretion chaperone [Thermodesulfobacteriota bacterium]